MNNDNNNHTSVISLMNFKGGCSKTMSTDLVCYDLAKMGKNILLVDLDPQANSTQVMGRTHKVATGRNFNIKETMMSAVAKNNLRPAIVNVVPHLDLLPSYHDFNYYPWFVINKYFNESKDANELHLKTISFFDKLMQPIIQSGKYDYIFYDCPPTVSTYVESALSDLDYIAVILQTEQPSFDEAKEFLRSAIRFSNKYHAHYNFLGMIAVLKKRSPVDSDVLARAEQYFTKQALIGTTKWYRRVERYSSQGISDAPNDPHDRRIHKIYTKLAKSIIKRVNEGGM